MKTRTILRWIAALLPAVLLPAAGGMVAPAAATDPAAAVAAIDAGAMAATITDLASVADDPAFAALAPSLVPARLTGMTTTRTVPSDAEAALVARINKLVATPGAVAVADALRASAGTRNHSDYWDHFVRAQQHAGATVGGATAIAGVWTVLVVPGIQRCGADANCVAFWVLLGAGLSVAGASYTAFEGVATGLEVAAFVQSAGFIGYALATWVVVCVYAGQQCDRPPV